MNCPRCGNQTISRSTSALCDQCNGLNTNKRPDGGPAFPIVEGTNVPGMTLRDYFAAKAMAVILARVQSDEDALKVLGEDGVLPFVVTTAYETADAMLEARNG